MLRLRGKRDEMPQPMKYKDLENMGFEELSAFLRGYVIVAIGEGNFREALDFALASAIRWKRVHPDQKTLAEHAP